MRLDYRYQWKKYESINPPPDEWERIVDANPRRVYLRIEQFDGTQTLYISPYPGTIAGDARSSPQITILDFSFFELKLCDHGPMVTHEWYFYTPSLDSRISIHEVVLLD